jgi:thiaminase/transcriptional activator TenA
MIFEKMCLAVRTILPKIHDLPFNRELAQGTLAQEKFIFYLKQDALYLADFSRALALSAAKLPNRQHAQQFMQFAVGALQAEHDLHQTYFTRYNILLTENDEQSPACFLYTNYLLKMVSTAAIEEAVASLLPCFWVYQVVGQRLAYEAKHITDHPYQAWINMYSSEEFASSANAAVQITNELGQGISAATEKKMLAAFIRSTQLEWLFWDSAYRQEQWQPC